MTVFSPEEMRIRFSGNKQREISMCFSWLQREGGAETPAQAKKEQGSCRGAEQGGISRTPVSFSGLQS